MLLGEGVSFKRSIFPVHSTVCHTHSKHSDRRGAFLGNELKVRMAWEVIKLLTELLHTVIPYS